MKFNVAIARPTDNGFIRQEVCNFVSAAWKTRFTDDWCRKRIEELIDIPCQKFPTDIARNCIVQAAQELEVDYLFMLDADASPNYGFFSSALQFLHKQPTASVIGCPYMSGDGEVQVYRFIQKHTSDPQQHHWAITRVPRADAFQRKGIEQIASIGTHTICYDMRAFADMKPPYYRYAYSPDHTQLCETEEMFAHRFMLDRGVKLYVDWDRWAAHWKLQEIGPLAPIPPEDIPQFWLERAKEHLMFNQEAKNGTDSV